MRNHLGRCAESRRRARARMRRASFGTPPPNAFAAAGPAAVGPDPAAPPAGPLGELAIPGSQLRVQAVPHRARQRGELPRAQGSAHQQIRRRRQARRRATRRARCESGGAGDGARAERRPAEPRGRNPRGSGVRVPRLEAERCPRAAAASATVPGGLPRDRGRSEAAAPVYDARTSRSANPGTSGTSRAIAAEPYEVIAFKVPNADVDSDRATGTDAAATRVWAGGERVHRALGTGREDGHAADLFQKTTRRRGSARAGGDTRPRGGERASPPPPPPPPGALPHTRG